MRERERQREEHTHAGAAPRKKYTVLFITQKKFLAIENRARSRNTMVPRFLVFVICTSLLPLISSFLAPKKICPSFTKYEATEPDARCLDGSRGSYHIMTAENSSSTMYFIHFQGGAWCYDVDSCLKRSLTDLGSSTSIGQCDSPSSLSDIHKYFAKTHHIIHINYCDGGSFSGNSSSTVGVCCK